MNRSSKIIVSLLSITVAGAVAYALMNNTSKDEHAINPVKNTGGVPAMQTKAVTPPIVKPPTVSNSEYYSFTFTTADPSAELTAEVGAANVGTVLKINRINSEYLKQGMTVTIPKELSDWMALSPFPATLPAATSIPKLDMISQRVQAFGVYENGTLAHWGPVSTGKQSTPTASKLYTTNWKGKEVHSSFSDEWILKWNFNLDNAEGIGMHQYTMPGYPASHSCVRMFGSDAEWLYNWADQWVLSPNEQTVVVHGTPVLVFGTYAYGKTAPWKKLPKDASATTLSVDELTSALNPNLDTIAMYQAERTAYNAQ